MIMQEAEIAEEAENSSPPVLDIGGQGPVLPNRFKFYGTVGAECLRQECALVGEYDERLQNVVDTLLATAYFYEAEGLAAPQIGALQRVFVAKINGEYKEFVNPTIIERDGTAKTREGCVSFPQATAYVTRAEDVVVQAHDVQGNMFTLALDGTEAVCIQHEVDHLYGVLFIDKMSPLYRRQTLKKTEKILRRFNLK